MNLIIFGATGLVGKQLVKQALYMGHHIKAYGRNVFTENLPENKELELIQGALFDEKQVLNAIKGCDAVLSALGGNFDGKDFSRSLGMKNMVAQMQKINVKRIVAVGNIGILNTSAEDATLIMDQPEFKPEYIPVSTEHFKAYNLLKASTLDWTLVCPPDIINAEVTGLFVTNADFPPTKNKYRVNAGDLAMFMLKEMTADEYLQHRVGISN